MEKLKQISRKVPFLYKPMQRLLSGYAYQRKEWAKKSSRFADRFVYRVDQNLIEISPQTENGSIQSWIGRYLENKPLQVVQIGSNDGKTGDPIFELIQTNDNWNALFVEPVPYLFQRLQANYGDAARFRFENVAINDGIEQPFYWVREEAKQELPNLPDWYDQLGSFDETKITKRMGGLLVPYMEQTIVKGLTLSELFSTHQITELELLHIDAEGYDWKILSQLDLSVYQPTIILFEHGHLSGTEKKASVSFLAGQYLIFRINRDILAIHKDKLQEADLPYLSK